MEANIKHKINNFLSSLVEKHQTPAVQYQLFDKEKVIHSFQTGMANIEQGKKVDDQTTFKAFSVTKTFTALAIMQLAAKGKLDIDTSASIYLSDFPYPKNITIRQLMTHSAGIPNPNPLSWIHLESEHEVFDPNRFFKSIFRKNNKVKSSPNEKFNYSNLGYVLLGQVIESITNRNNEEFIYEKIFKKLDCSSNELGFTIADRNQDAKGYHKYLSFTNWIIGFFINKSKYREARVGKWQAFKNYYVNGAPYGGLIGTPTAFRSYLQELLKPNCWLLSEDYKKMLFIENYTNNNKATGMCLSWFKGSLKGQEYYYHPGGGGGYYCEVRIYPALGIGSVIMFNRSGMSDERFLDRVDSYYFENQKL